VLLAAVDLVAKGEMAKRVAAQVEQVEVADGIVGQVLALLRGAVLRLHDKESFESLNASFHHHSAKPYAGLRRIQSLPTDAVR
jgi:hypothetical protein